MKTHRSLLAAFAAFVLLTTTQAQTTAPLDEARTAFKAGDLTKAESLLVPLTGPEARDAAAFHVLGQVRERQRNLPAAVAAYEQAAKLEPTKPDYFSAHGVALSQRMGELGVMQHAMTAGKMKKAFEKSVALDPKHVAGLIGLARYYTSAPEIAGGSPALAREYAGRVREIVPFLGEIELGKVDREEEKYAEALGHFEAAAKLNPNHAEAQNQAGQMLARLGRKDEARARFEAALKLNPQSESARKGLTALAQPAG
jgi:Flp pilus assembly protein TadD